MPTTRELIRPWQRLSVALAVLFTMSLITCRLIDMDSPHGDNGFIISTCTIHARAIGFHSRLNFSTIPSGQVLVLTMLDSTHFRSESTTVICKAGEAAGRLMDIELTDESS